MYIVKKDQRIDKIDVHVLKIPTDTSESDGTFAWTQTTLVVAQVYAGGLSGIGYSYGDASIGNLIMSTLSPILIGKNAFSVLDRWVDMVRCVRNLGRPGIASHAISVLDIALWDLKASLLEIPLCTLLGQFRNSIPVYGSGGFTSYSVERLQDQLAAWVKLGIRMVKMKVGTNPKDDPIRVRAAREAIGPHVGLFVDANGAYDRKQALVMANLFSEQGVSWFEEPVSSDDLEGLKLIRNKVTGMNITAGEYGYDIVYFRRMLERCAVDVLQVDATRCCGITGFMKTGVLCDAWMIPLSSHTAPTLHAHLCCSTQRACHVEYFYDHARIEHLIFDGALSPEDGNIQPDPHRAGLGIRLRLSEVNRYAA